MPNWKKVITSGSTAILNEITSSGGITGDLKLQQELEANQTVGGVLSGTTFDQGSSVETLLRSILITFIQSSLGTPGLKTTAGGSISTSVREVGTSSNFTAGKVTFTAGSNSPNGLFPHQLTVTASNADTGNFEEDLTSETLGSNNTFDFATSHTLGMTSFTSNSKNISLRIKAFDQTNNAELNAYRYYTFVYPIYYNVSTTDLSSATGTDIEDDGATKLIKTKPSSQDVTWSASSQYLQFAYPSRYGNLSQIKDGNGFNVTTSFTKYTITINGGNGWTGAEYFIYQSNGTTSISSQTYQFIF